MWTPLNRHRDSMPICLIWCTGCFKACNKYLNRTEKTLLVVLNIPSIG